MKQIKSSGSKIETLLGKALWADGFRYRRQYKVVGKPDFVLVKLRIAIFCDSSFWHGYGRMKTKRHNFKSNKQFWIDKISRNILRDKFVNSELKKAGWQVVRFWDFEITKDVEKCIKKIKLLVSRQS